MHPNLATLTRVFARIGLMSFGGPAAQIAVMHRELVEDRPWLSEQQFLNALSFCMLLPGPEAMQLCTYAGWRLRGVRGGLIAGLLFVVPGALVMLALAWAYAVWGKVPAIEALFLGIKAAVTIVVFQALFKLSSKTLRTPDRWVIAGLSFLAIYAFGAPFPAIIALAALYGAFRIGATGEVAATPLDLNTRTPRTIAVWLTLWWAPILALWAFGATHLAAIGFFFSKLAVVTFGGAYAVLAYMAQEVVEAKGWLSAPQMMDGLGLAETTPGPLILVTQFVGYLAGYGAGGWLLGLGAAIVTIWATFVPCFLWIFTAAPYVEWIASRPRLTGALSAITAAVAGVIANLSLWFSMHVFFDAVEKPAFGPLSPTLPVWGSFNLPAVALAGLAAYLLLRLRLSLPIALCVMALAGALLGVIEG